eukprot:TRINITY_DN423_c0_g2_i1.p1 TRINITY_DN423_c0_g2~~TRINITY_DN423_c0_g2_i1.p1  ORF type:complete len:527 (+),score=107.90 TRINITY_DN423_c0_g2_i1:436-2016(+)
MLNQPNNNSGIVQGSTNLYGSRHEVSSESGHSGSSRGISDASSVMYATTPYRWLVLTAVFLLNLINAAFWLTYSPISDDVAEHYKVNKNVVNILSLCMSGTYGPVVWTAAPLVRKFGFGHACRGAAFMTAAGGVVRFLGGPSDDGTFWLVIVGQCLSGVARPIISQLLGLVALQWFPAHQRVLATAISALGNPFGIGLAFVLSPSIVKDSDVGKVWLLNLVNMFIGLAMFAFVMAFVRDRPKHDPSEAAISARTGENEIPFTQELSYLKNWQYWLMALAFGLGFGQTNAIAVILNQLLKPFGYSHGQVGIAGVMTILPGVIGAGLVAAVLGKKPLHREALIIIYAIGAVLLQGIMLLACKTPNSPAILYVSAALFGFFAQPCFSVALELAAETVYPASPAVAAAGVVMCAQYVGLFVSAFFGWYINEGSDDSEQRDRVHVTGFVMSGSWLLACILMVFFRKDNLGRYEYEREQRAIKQLEKNEEKRKSRIKKKVNIIESQIVDESDSDNIDDDAVETQGLIQDKDQ